MQIRDFYEYFQWTKIISHGMKYLEVFFQHDLPTIVLWPSDSQSGTPVCLITRQIEYAAKRDILIVVAPLTPSELTYRSEIYLSV